MKIQFASDLHLEFLENRKYLTKHPLNITGDVLVLAGDIFYLNRDEHIKFDFWDWASDNYCQTIAIPGNHEFYGGGDIASINQGGKLSIRSNVNLHYNTTVEINGVKFILTPLWSKIPYEQALITRQSVADFSRIRFNNNPFSVDMFNEEHCRCVEFVANELASNSANKMVVVSHHVPSLSCTAAEFKNSQINGAFTANLDDLISDNSADYWLYGHSHRNLESIRIGNTTLLSNQLGYVALNEHKSFKHDVFIQV